MQHGIPTGWIALFDNNRPWLAVDLFQMVRPGPFGRCNAAFDERPVGFFDATVFELLRNPLRGFEGFGEDDCTGHGAVETMGNAEINFAGEVIALTQKAFDAVFKAVDAEGRLGEEARGLGDGKAGFVFEEYL